MQLLPLPTLVLEGNSKHHFLQSNTAILLFSKVLNLEQDVLHGNDFLATHATSVYVLL